MKCNLCGAFIDDAEKIKKYKMMPTTSRGKKIAMLSIKKMKFKICLDCANEVYHSFKSEETKKTKKNTYSELFE